MAKGGRISLKKGRKIGVSWVIPSRHHGGFNSHALNDLDDDWGSPILGHLHTIVMINWAVFKTQNVMTLYCWVNRDLQNGWWRSATYWIVWLQSSTTNQGFVSHCSSEQYVVTSSYQQSTSTEAPLTTSLCRSYPSSCAVHATSNVLFKLKPKAAAERKQIRHVGMWMNVENNSKHGKKKAECQANKMQLWPFNADILVWRGNPNVETTAV